MAIQTLVDSALPNCIDEEAIEAELFDSENKAVCRDCKNRFQARTPEISSDSLLKRIRQKAYIEMMYNELEKNLAQTVNSVTSLRKLPNMNNEFTLSKNQCSLQKWNSRLKSNCSPFATELLLKMPLGERLASEIAATLNASEHPIEGMLIREGRNQCNIPDDHIMHAVIESGVESIDAGIVNKIATMNQTDPNQFFNELSMLNLPHEVFNLFISHPVFSAIAKNPAAIITFFKELQSSSPNPNLSEAIRSKIYNPNRNSSIDEAYAKSCEDSFKNFFDRVCSLGEQDVDLAPLKNVYHLMKEKDFTDVSPLASSPELIERNAMLFSFCEEVSRPSISFSNSIPLNPNPLDQYAGMPFQEFAFAKYDKEIATPGGLICQKTIDNNCTPQSNDYPCRLVKKYRALYPAGSTQLAENSASFNPKVNELLREIIGSNVQVPPEIRTVLVQNGILGDESQVDEKPADSTPSIPSGRGPVNSQTAAGTTAKTPGRTVPPSRGNSVPGPGRTSVSNTSSLTQYSPAAISDPDANDFDESGFQDELRRRLSGAAANTSAPISGTARPASGPDSDANPLPTNGRSSRRQGSSGNTGNFTVPAPALPFPENFTTSTIPSSIPLPDDQETPSEALAREQRTAAYAHLDRANRGPAGSGSTTAGSATVTNGEGRVVISAPEDRIRLNLEDVLNENLLQGPLSEQLEVYLETKRDFYLEINSSLFQVTFNERTRAFSVLPKNGEAQTDLATRLETYLNRRITRSHSLRDLQTTLPR